ncbi:MAG TPA: TetR/AcrR family transcriptional regulator [Ktedonobacteraceae bacterium]|nr:TetR/AcrR family transcriptional regulator [Ktedonobacteraceae bacterium]
MSEPGSRRGRVHNAEGAREAILNAAEEAFAEQGFDGARIDAIAARAGYNKSLIFQYFGDKLSLYVEVMKRADQEMSKLQENVFTHLHADETIVSDVRKFRAFLESIVGMLFDFLEQHPRLIRIFLWEQADGWQTYQKIFEQLLPDEIEPWERFFDIARKNGLLHSDFSPTIQLTTALQICLSHLAGLPLYKMVQPDMDLYSAEGKARSRTYIINLIVAGILVDTSDDSFT